MADLSDLELDMVEAACAQIIEREAPGPARVLAETAQRMAAEIRRARERTWQGGVEDAIRIVENRHATAKALGYKPEYLVALDETSVFLRAMLARGAYKSTSTTCGGDG